MKNWILLFLFSLLFVLGFSQAAESTVIPPQTPSILETILGFLNSSVGVTAIGGIIVWILGKVFTAKPEWKVYYDRYQPLLISAVKQAEKAIPDDTDNKALKRMDFALKYVLTIEGSLANANQTALKDAITAVHAEAEAKENI